jgi:hypothetical protein
MNFLGRGNFGVVFGGGKKGKGSRRLLGLGLYGITTTAMMKTCFMHSSRHHIINTAEDLDWLLSCFEKNSRLCLLYVRIIVLSEPLRATNSLAERHRSPTTGHEITTHPRSNAIISLPKHATTHPH